MYTNEIVIDMGFNETVIAMRGKGVVLKEPSVIAAVRVKEKYKFLASGTEAKRYMRSRERDLNAVLVHPVKGGVIEDVNAAILMLKDFLRKAMPRRLFGPRPEVIATIACGTSVVERKNYENVLAAVGLKSPILMEVPIAVSALAAGEYNLIATIGASVSDVAIVGPNGIITGCSVTMSGNAVDEKICAYVAENYRLGITPACAEDLRKKIGTYRSNGQISSKDVLGRNLVDETPYQAEITSNEIAPMLASVMTSFADVIESVSMMCPEKHCMDVYNAGITLCGGYAYSDGLSDFLFERLNIPIHVPKNPDETVAIGALSFFEDRDRMYKML